MQVVILCGGRGTRAYPQTAEIPKALMQVDGVPILEHVIRIYAAQGYDDFILSCGYLMDQIVDYFDNNPLPVRIQCVDTGEDADTGDRIWRLRDRLGPDFHATYCDGLGNINLASLNESHHSHPSGATVTAVPLRSQYGIILPDGDNKVAGFDEKPVLSEHWINGGFFVFNREVFAEWRGNNLEQEVLPHLAEAGMLYMYRHSGFWRSMDTYKDQQELNSLWRPFSSVIASQLGIQTKSTLPKAQFPRSPEDPRPSLGDSGSYDA